MYAKWIHPKKIVIHEGNILRYCGRIVVNPKAKNYAEAGYFPVILKEGQSLTRKDNIYIVKENTIVILDEEDT